MMQLQLCSLLSCEPSSCNVFRRRKRKHLQDRLPAAGLELLAELLAAADLDWLEVLRDKATWAPQNVQIPPDSAKVLSIQVGSNC